MLSERFNNLNTVGKLIFSLASPLLLVGILLQIINSFISFGVGCYVDWLEKHFSKGK